MTVSSERWRQRLVVTRFVLLHVAALSVLIVPFRWGLVWWRPLVSQARRAA